ncbi:MAG: TolC family protein [Kofleriaceae bacterium]
MRIHATAAFAASLVACGAPVGAAGRDHNTLAPLRHVERSTAVDVTRVVEAPYLELDALVAAVLARNPALEAARQRAHAAEAGVAAAGAFDDPMLTYEIAPLSVAGDDRFGQRVSIGQRLPFPGKRALATDLSRAHAEVARGDYLTARQDLAAMTADLYADLYLVERSLDVNREVRALVETMQRSAEAHLAVGHGAPQDSLAAQVELEHLASTELVLQTERAVLVARLNGLLHRAPDARIPPTPSASPAPAAPSAVAQLERDALAQRPEVGTAAAEVRAGEVAAAQARREAYPDVTVMATYTSMTAMPAHQWMLGVALPIPLQRGRRAASVRVGDARTASAEAGRLAVHDQIRVEVAAAHAGVTLGLELEALYRDRLVPAARDQIDAALAGYATGVNDFAAVIAAEQRVYAVSLEAHRVRADLWRRQAALDRAVGRLPGGAS